MSDHPHDGRLETVITLPRAVVQDMIAALTKRCARLAEAEVECKASSHRSVLRAARLEVGELLAELQWQVTEKRPYHYVVPLTPEEARALDEELNGGRRGSTHP